MTQPGGPYPFAVQTNPIAPVAPAAAPVAPQGIDWSAIQARESRAKEEETRQVDEKEARRSALREEIGIGETVAHQFARGALDALLAPGALVGAAAQGVGELWSTPELERFGRDLGRSASGKSAAEALGFISGGGGTAGAERADAARVALERQEEARPTLALLSRMAGQTAFAIGVGAGGAGSSALKTIGANALEGAAAGAQAGYEQADAPLKDVLTYAAVGGILGGGLSAVGEGVGAGVQAAKRRIASGDLDKVFGKVQQFADERMIKTAIGNDAKTMRALTDNGQDWGRVSRVAQKMREADLPNDADQMLSAITQHADNASQRLSDVAADLDSKLLKPNAADLFNEIGDQTARLRSMGTGDAQLVADAVERQVAPLRQSLAVSDEAGNVLHYRDPTFTDLRRFKTGLGQALKWHKRAPSISDDAMSELYGNVARKLDAAADAAGPEYGAAWRRANQDATDWLTVQSGLEEEMQRRLKNRFISPSDYGTGIAGALMTMMASGNPLAALAGGAVSSLAHRAARYGGSKIAEGLANRFAKMRVHIPMATAGGKEGQEILQTIARTKQFMTDTAERAGQNPAVRETASEAAREVAVDQIAKLAGPWDPANWRNPNPLAKVVHRSQILDQAAQEISAATRAVTKLRSEIPEALDTARLAKLMRDGDGLAAIGKVQTSVQELLGSLPPTPAGSAIGREARLVMDKLRRADPAEAFALTHRLSTTIDDISSHGITSPDLDLVAERGLDNLKRPKEGMRPESFERVRAEYASGQEMMPVAVTVFPDGDIIFQDGRHRLEVAKELGIPAIPTRVSRMNKRGEVIEEIDAVLPIQPGEVVRTPADQSTIDFSRRGIGMLREALSDASFGKAGQRYSELVNLPPDTLSALSDPAALRDVLVGLKEAGQLSGQAEDIARQIEASHSAASALAGWPKQRGTAKELQDWKRLVQDGEDASLVDGQPLVKIFDASTDAPKPVNDTTVLETVGAEVDKIVPVLKLETKPRSRAGKLRAVPGFTAPETMSLGDQRKLYDRHMEILTDQITNPGQLADKEIRGGPVVAAAAAERLQNLLNEMPKPVETIRGKQHLSQDELRRANAMWEATMEPLSVFGDFARGDVDYDKVKYAWRQYPGLQQAAQAGVVDILTTELDDKQREAIPDPVLSQLDYLLGFGGKLQPNVAPDFAARMSALPPQEQKDQPKPGGMLELPGAEPTWSERVAGAS